LDRPSQIDSHFQPARDATSAFLLVNHKLHTVKSGVISFDAELQQRLADLRGQGLLRELRRVDSPQGTRVQIGGQTLLNFSSNDYLGLANDPRLKDAAIKAVEKFGAGAGASRLICGSLAPHHELEEALAHFKATGAALSFSSGYATAVGTICALLGRDDIVILDKLVHACIVDAARLSGAKIRVFAHNDLNDLEDKLKWAEKVQGPRCRADPHGDGKHFLDGRRRRTLTGNRRPQGAIRRMAHGG
jgi:7-keto-8-aminopelargonate synthetase-like enzyme